MPDSSASSLPAFIDADVLILAPEHGDQVYAVVASVFESIERLPCASIRYAGRTRDGGFPAGARLASSG
jgi:hypothetical protein